MQIDSSLHQRQGGAVSNFANTLPAPESDLAHNLLKDPYQFDFLTLADNAREKEIERSLLEHIRKFLLELGVGFAFVGSQYHLEVDRRDFYVDLLVLPLSATLLLCVGTENRSVSAGICRDHDQNRLVVEYALRDMNKPIGVAGFETQLVESLPKTLEGSFPSVEQLETELKNPPAKPA